MVPIAWTYLLRDYQKARLIAFLDANPDIQGAGFQLHQAQIAVGSGGLFGKGLTNGTQTQGDFLPVQATRLRVRDARPRSSGSSARSSCSCCSCCCCGGSSSPAGDRATRSGRCSRAAWPSMILFQLIVNVGMVLGVMPITGIPLPFVTHGGASLVSMAVGLGILQSINIRQTRAAW